MCELMLGLQVRTGASVRASLQLLHVCYKTTQRSASVIPVVGFYNSKNVFLLFFFFFPAELCAELDQQCRIYYPRPAQHGVFIAPFPHVLVSRAPSCA